MLKEKENNLITTLNNNRTYLKNILTGQTKEFVFATTDNEAEEIMLRKDIFLEFEMPKEQIYSQITNPRKIKKAVLYTENRDESSKKTAINTIDSREYSLLDGIESNSTLKKQYSGKLQNIIALGCQSFYCLIKHFLDNEISREAINTIILVESSTSEFNKLLALIDMQQLVKLINDNDICLEMVLNANSSELREGIYRYFSNTNPFILYSLGLVKSDDLAPALLDIEEWLFNESGIGYRYITNMGFSTDEMNQLINASFTYGTASNIKNFRDFKPGRKEELCVVTGSGPSIDEHIEWLKENKHKVTVFAAGSSVKTLLKAGIESDVLVMTERNSVIYDYIQSVIEEYPDLSKTILVCSDTVDPRIIKLFNTVYLFQRPISAVSALFFEQRPNSLLTAGPETVNACIEAAIYSGYHEILLMGCDCGAKVRQNPRSLNAYGLSPREMNIPVAGNKGRTVYSQPSLLLVRDQIERCIQVFKEVTFMRLGEGAYIKDEIYLDTKKYSFDKNSKKSITCDETEVIDNIPFIDVDKKIYELDNACRDYLEQISTIVEEGNKWDSRLEKNLAKCMNVDLIHEDEKKISLSARRLLRQLVYNILHNYYISFSSEEERVEANKDLKISLKNTYKIVKEILDAITEELRILDGNIDGWSHERLKNIIRKGYNDN